VNKVRNGIARAFYSIGKNRVVHFMRELDEMDWWSQDELVTDQHNRLLALLEYANDYIPYYRELFQEIGFHPGDFAADPGNLAKIPILTKDIVRENHDRLITTEQNARRRLIKIKTGGTTGEPLWIKQEPRYIDFTAAITYHKMTWSGWELGEPQCWLWGHPIVGVDSEASTSAQARDWLAHRLRSNAFLMTDESMEELARKLEGKPDTVLSSYVSTLYRFAEFVQQKGYEIRLRAAFIGAEPVFDYHRQFIEENLACSVFDNYSSVEMGSMACECEEHSGLHISSQNCYLEVLRDGQPVPDGEEGEFIVTNLGNLGFPLIRYRTDDWGRKSIRRCPCGRGLPLLEIVEGRVIDHFKTKDGRLVWGAFVIPMVPTLGPIKQYQIVQKSVDLIVFQVIAVGSLDMEKFQEIQQTVKAVLGNNVETQLEFVDSLPKTPTGKHRFTISEVR
jgi:phenylacetate-CoA ligase